MRVYKDRDSEVGISQDILGREPLKIQLFAEETFPFKRKTHAFLAAGS